MANIMTITGRQLDKIHGTYNGGLRYGHDYNILKAIVEYHNDKCLVENLVKSLRDRTLMGKVRVWMGGT